MQPMSQEQFLDALDSPYAWPGGYPTYLIMADYEPLCMKCADKERITILSAYGYDDEQWLPIAHEIMYENQDGEYCVHCNKILESAYGGETEIVVGE